ncbi:dihydroorotase [Alkalibacillus almallahensis]|uniref:dihydroorotase n=1 Tax=Alkalibacillus almallahensis TaxID=1379154 RepID=UPI00142130D3|nr:dihydroorotase [Alkalibacillus almallahensis]NIK10720.1 dihydroorotase [Alkalibacillus almallahensis]
MRQLIKNVMYQGEMTHVLIDQGKIASIGDVDLSEADHVIDGRGQRVAPGFVDLHVHLREPGGEQKETIATGTQAAARGGFTTICAMPNTNPIPDEEVNLAFVQDLIKRDAFVRVLPYAAITTGQTGESLVDMKQLTKQGAVAFTDDGVGVQSAGTMFEAMQQAAQVGQPVVTHCEDNSLVYGGVMHDGERNRSLNLPGIPSLSESVQIARDVLLAEAAHCHYHVCHVSTKESVRVIRDAKRAGIHVTAEVTPHHLLLSENDIPLDDAHYKMNPPLRSEADRQALIEGLEDGTIDCIATDHAPHTSDEKSNGFLASPFGIVGLETAFPLLYTHFVETGHWSIEQLIDWLTVKPATIFHLPYGRLEMGAPADLVLINTTNETVIDSGEFLSKGRNTPFHGYTVKGIPTLTMMNGDIVWQKEETYA